MRSAVLLALTGCAPRSVVVKPTPQAVKPPAVATKPGPTFRVVHRYVVPADLAAQHWPREEFFTPSDAEIARVDTALFKLVLQEQRGELLWPPQGEYFVRYVGRVKDGRRNISIMAVSAVIRDIFDGKNPPLDYMIGFYAFDGGCSFFEAEFDLSSSTLGPAHCNGQA